MKDIPFLFVPLLAVCLVLFGIIVLYIGQEEANKEVKEVEIGYNPRPTGRRLFDFDIHWVNKYDRPVDEISCLVKSTGEIFTAPLIRDIYILPGESGIFSTLLEIDELIEMAKGYEVINVRLR